MSEDEPEAPVWPDGVTIDYGTDRRYQWMVTEGLSWFQHWRGLLLQKWWR